MSRQTTTNIFGVTGAYAPAFGAGPGMPVPVVGLGHSISAAYGNARYGGFTHMQITELDSKINYAYNHPSPYAQRELAHLQTLRWRAAEVLHNHTNDPYLAAEIERTLVKPQGNYDSAEDLTDAFAGWHL